MDFLAEGFRRAWALLAGGDAEVYGIALLTLKVAVVATTISCVVGLPLGYFLATRRFWGRRAATVVNTALAFPTVVVGLPLYGMLSRAGHSVASVAVYLAGTYRRRVAALIAAALSAAAIQGVDPRIRRTAQTLGAGRWLTVTVTREVLRLAAVITAAFGRVVAEIGAAMIVGSNIRGSTRTLTTAVALPPSQGDFGMALALGLILLVLALLVNIALQVLQGRGRAGGETAVVELRDVGSLWRPVVLDFEQFARRRTAW
jgi:tungstate transport system permease protein